MVEVTGLASRFDNAPVGPWAEPPNTAVVVPLRSRKGNEPFGLLVAGVSSRLVFDQHYRSFYELTANHIATAMMKARAYEEERKRAEALAEIDRVKTAFFSNVSHEFRTPLTLILGPLEDTLASANLAAGDRERLNVVQRNSLRLLKLVNSLLDFSRIEAGRTRASYEPTDIAGLTRELASNFLPACAHAGLKLVVDCPPLPEMTYVDRDMWEKIVLNLLSNAFKFTFEGGITVRLRAVDGHAELSIRDTGVGVPTHELPRLCAYTGARVNEITSLLPSDVQQIVKHWCFVLRPEVTKGKRLRRVPIHKHLIEQGFLKYVEERRRIGKPLFYEPARARGGKGANPQWQKVAERLGGWVHESLKVSDVQPNHGWRHLWREIVRGTKMKPELCDYMCGHESKSGTGARYGKRKVPILVKEMALFPRFKVPALGRQPLPHRRVRRTSAQVAADDAAKAARRAARANAA